MHAHTDIMKRAKMDVQEIKYEGTVLCGPLNCNSKHTKT